MCPRERIVRPKATAVARGEIAQDGVRFPNDVPAIGNHGNAAVRVHGKKGRRVEPAERTAGIDVLMRKIEFTDQPHHFLDVE